MPSSHIQNTNTQYNLPSFEGKKISRKFNHAAVAGRFDNPSVNLAIQADLTMIDAFNRLMQTAGRPDREDRLPAVAGNAKMYQKRE
jgi:hypothetical protein